ncbi:MAG: hypothetical protein ACKO14_04965 [Armatimonadota bacterium]
MRNLVPTAVLASIVYTSGSIASDSNKLRLTVFLATDCPIAGRTARLLSTQLSILRKSNVGIEIVFPNAYETKENTDKWIREHGLAGLGYSLSFDSAVHYKIRTTPTTLLTRGTSVLYTGKLSERDDSNRPGIVYPVRALAAIANGKSYLKSTAVTGCPIRLQSTKALPTNASTEIVENIPVSWNSTVKSIFEKSCVPCHTGNGVGPVKLISYSDVYGMSTKISTLVSSRTMPPWQAEDIGKFHDDPSLSLSELQTLGLWFKRGLPIGGSSPSTIQVPTKSSTTWDMGTPSSEIEMPTPYVTPSSGKDHYRCFVFKSITDRDRWMNGIAFRPGATQSVHHVSAFIDTSGAARKMDDADPGPGYTNPTPGNGPGFKDYYVIGGWTPGHKPRKLPPGSGIPIPKGADLVVEVHYHLTGKQETDSTTTGLYFTDDSVDKRYRVGDVGTYNIAIKANDPAGKADASAVINSNVSIHSVTPHLHLLGRTMKVTAELPNGELITIINIRRWDFRWQPSYRFLKPLQLPRGTRIDVLATYDNTKSNPDNPHSPPRDIVWGEGTDEEMCSVFFGYTDDDEHLVANHKQN